MGEANILLKLKGGTELGVRQLTSHERMSQPFRLDIVAVSKLPAQGATGDKGPYVELGKIVGQSAAVRVTQQSGNDRVWSGVVSHVEQVRWDETPGAESTYYLRVMPSLHLLSQRRGQRIFQHKRIPEIVKALFEEWKLETEWRIDEASYPVKEYCVQHDETDLDFTSRLLEEAGIAYFFGEKAEGQGEGHSVLILSDQPQAQPVALEIPYVDDPNEVHVPLWASNVRIAHDVRPGRYQLSDFNFRKPALPLFAPAPPAPGTEGKREIYRYEPGGFLVETGGPGQGPGDEKVADDKSTTIHDHEKVGKSRAQRFLEAERHDKRHIDYETSAQNLVPGKVLRITDHPHGELEGKSLLTIATVTHVDASGKWTVTCEGAFADVPYRPARRTPQPRVAGVQSAIVVGPKGDEIYTDEFGRVRVRFHWDREGDFDDTRTCWLRLSQPWAGAQYGTLMLPRVGHEVIVDFLDGDPDQPVVVGRLYTQPAPPPYKLPDHATRSTWQSNTTPDQPKTKNFNEIMFEDLKGEELVLIQAQRNMLSLTKHNETERTGFDRSHVVGRDFVHIVGKVDARHVGEQHLVQVVKTDEKKLKILEKEEPAYDKTDTFIEVKSAKISLTTGKASIVLDGADITVQADKGLRMSADQDFVIQGGPMVFINAAGAANVDPDAFRKIRDEIPEPEGRILHAIVQLFAAGRDPAKRADGAELAVKALLEDAVKWGEHQATHVKPRHLPKPEKAAQEAKDYDQRQKDIAAAYAKAMAGKIPTPSDVGQDRLRAAHEGDPVTGERVPLTFKTPEQYHRFQQELGELLASEGITDATVQQVGSGTTGWKGNPKKPKPPAVFDPLVHTFKPTSDADFAIFSPQMLAQAKANDSPVNPKIVQGGRYTILKNHAQKHAGFYRTPIGHKLKLFAHKWNKEIYGKARGVDGFDFKLNLSTKPFGPASKAITAVKPA
ncbi:MAG: type VI secretion system tip protein VgrG [Deltaproteobacteria bacterium]|nr:type VI secretion system tip protein VgrG [Deltaproteobacteria bacterium]